MADIYAQPGYLKDWLIRCLLAEQLGTGMYRTVYSMRHCDNLVVKVENNEKPEFCNVLEYEFWTQVQNTKWAKYFAPVHGIAGHGTLLLMERTTPITREEFDAEVKRLPNFMDDIHYGNFGRLNGQIVCHDYAFTLANDHAIKFGRLIKARHAGDT